ncbi:MAG TPA: zinc-binding alcohol dehydrogenase family protein [Cyclobacteriaceae bacterium]
MNAIILIQPGKFEFAHQEINENLDPDEVLLKVHRIGVCGTDLHAFRGKQPFFSYPRILGHELGVEVIKIGKEVIDVKIGDRCALEPYFNMKEGQAFRNGKSNCGEHVSVFGVHEDGGMRRLIKVKSKYLHSSKKLSFDQLALVETLAIGCHAVNRAEVKSTDKVLIIGAGPIGLATLEFVKIKKAKVIVMDVQQSRLNFCRDILNADGVINAQVENIELQLRNQFNEDLPTIVFDATGNSQSMMKAFEFPSHGGKLVFIGLFQGDVTFHDPLFHRKELTLLASRNALGSEFKEVIRLLENGEIDTSPWITHRTKFENVIDQFESWTKPETGVIKAMIEVN